MRITGFSAYVFVGGLLPRPHQFVGGSRREGLPHHYVLLNIGHSLRKWSGSKQLAHYPVFAKWTVESSGTRQVSQATLFAERKGHGDLQDEEQGYIMTVQKINSVVYN